MILLDVAARKLKNIPKLPGEPPSTLPLDFSPPTNVQRSYQSRKSLENCAAYHAAGVSQRLGVPNFLFSYDSKGKIKNTPKLSIVSPEIVSIVYTLSVVAPFHVAHKAIKKVLFQTKKPHPTDRKYEIVAYNLFIDRVSDCG